MTDKYAVIIEKGKTGYGAYVPDLPGCVAVARTRQKVERLIREAIPIHIEEMILHGDPVPKATSRCCYVAVDGAKVQKSVRKNGRVTLGS